MRALWAAVVVQAIDDIRKEPIHGIVYQEAVSFFTAGNDWLQSRTYIADFLETTELTLRRIGEREIKLRRQMTGLPIVVPSKPSPPPIAIYARPLPKLHATPAPAPQRRRASDFAFNPFDCRLADRK